MSDQGHYVLTPGKGRPFDLASATRSLTTQFVLDKRFAEAIGAPFLAFAGAYDLVRESARLDVGTGLRKSGFAIFKAWTAHAAHTAAALALVRVAGGALAMHSVEQYDAADRRIFEYVARFLSVLRLPTWLAYIVGNKPQPGDAALFDHAGLDPVAAAQDSLKRNALFDAANVVSEVVATAVGTAAHLDAAVYSLQPWRVLPRTALMALTRLVVGAAGAAAGRAIDSRNGNAEFAGELLARMFVGPYLAHRLNAALLPLPPASAAAQLKCEWDDKNKMQRAVSVSA
jgi:hypothetical protein